MSLSWRERLVVTLAPDRVLLRPQGPLWRQARGETRSLSCQGAADTAEPWRGPLSQLASIAEKNIDLEVVLSSHFVRLQLLPWQAELGRREEWVAYAGFRFHEIYGSLADAWDIVLSMEPPGRPMVACAVDRALLGALNELARERGWRLRSVEPAFSRAWNRHRGSLRGPAGVFALAEPGRVCAGLSRGGEWFALRNQIVGELDDALSAMLEQQALLAESSPVAGGEVLVVGLDGGRLPEPSGLPPGWSPCRTRVSAKGSVR